MCGARPLRLASGNASRRRAEGAGSIKTLRTVHRLTTLLVVAVALYLALTGIVVQGIDLRSILRRAPANDANVMAMREAFDGPSDYVVRSVADYGAQSLPTVADLPAMLMQTMRAARITVGDTPLRYVELRMVDGRPAGIVEAAGRFARFDPVTGEITGAGFSARTDPDTPESQRNTWKHLHRMTGFGHAALYINVVTGIGLSVLIVTGSLLYFKMLRTRSRSKVANPFWAGGGAWRTWHRRISIAAAVFLAVVTLSGLWLAYESLVFGAYFGSAQQQAETRAFAEAQLARAGSPSPPRPDPMSAESETGRLNSLQHDLLLTDAEMVSVKTVLDASASSYAALSKAGTDSAAAQASAIALHQREAVAVLAVLPERSRLQYGAWREAQRLGQPVPAVAGAYGGQQRSRGSKAGVSGPADPASPLVDDELPGMLRVTLNAERTHGGAAPIKVIRLRYYAGIPQGVLVTGGDDNKQRVVQARTGRIMTETEPGYPPVGFPFGWQAHQWAKDIHRGSAFGLPGRVMDMLSGLALIYLCASGAWIYLDLWRRRRKAGKTAPAWI